MGDEIMAGKNINYYLMDGTSSGRIKCTIANWTGVAYRIPRTDLEKCKQREDLKQSGVYFLFGEDEETEGKLVYIGQAGIRKNGEGILYRLQEHRRNTDKNYWTEAVVFTTSNNSFGPTEISWLENSFRNHAVTASRFIVKNANDPNSGHVTEEKESELEEFVDNAKIVMGVLGYKLFEPLIAPSTRNYADNDITPPIDTGQLSLRRKIKKSGVTIEATCVQTAEGFIVKKGSMIEKIDSSSIPPGIKKQREIAKVDDMGILQEDVLFKSPSYAAAFVIGGHANGLTAWVNSDGVTLKDIEQADMNV
jgi:hypothetical protein